LDIYVVFSPLEPKKHEATAYLDITGSESRIPLNMSGNGIGPKFRFGFEVMDLGTIFLGGAHSYEVI
jgi:hydrocephalus-inducing protein